MYSIVTYLSTFPATLDSQALAHALGCSVATAAKMCRDGDLCATKVDGHWSIESRELLKQLLVIRTPALAA